MKCNVCESSRMYKYPYNYHQSRSVFKNKVLGLFEEPKLFKGTIKVCERCGYGEMMNPPNQKELDLYYEEIYRPSFNRQKYMVRNENQGKFIGIHEKDVGSLLEIGGGVYPFTTYWRKKIKTTALVEKGTYAMFAYRDISEVGMGRFDLIHCSHVLEHILDIEDFLYRIHSLLSEDGKLFIEVPDCRFPDYWKSDRNDEPHVHFFTEDCLEVILWAAGFHCEKFGNELEGEKGPIIRGLFYK